MATAKLLAVQKKLAVSAKILLLLTLSHLAYKQNFLTSVYFPWHWFVSPGSWCQSPKPNSSVWKCYSWENQLSGGGGAHQPDHRAGQPTSQRLRGKQGDIEEFGGVTGLTWHKMNCQFVGAMHRAVLDMELHQWSSLEVVMSWQDRLTVVWVDQAKGDFTAWPNSILGTCETGREGWATANAWLNWATGWLNSFQMKRKRDGRNATLTLFSVSVVDRLCVYIMCIYCVCV